MKQGKLYKLGDICDFQGGSQPPKQEWIRTPKEGYVRMLQIRDFTQSREFIIEYVKCSKKLRYCNEDDILIGRYGASVGKILTGLGGAYNVAIIKTIPNEQIITKAYIRRFFEGDVFQALLQKVCGQRTAQAGFSKEDIVDCPIFVPSLSEQQRIVSLLDAEFAKIDALKANAEKNLQNAKDLFQAALKKELEPKEGWKKYSIKDVATLKAGKSFDKTDAVNVYKHGYFPCFGGNGQRGFVPYYNHDGKYNIIGRQGALCGNINVAEGKFYATEHAVVVSPIIPIAFDFLYYLLVNANINQYATGAAQPGISVAHINEVLFLHIPNLQVQKSVVAHLETLKTCCNSLEANYEKTLSLCDDLKQALLRKAFNGEI